MPDILRIVAIPTASISILACTGVREPASLDLATTTSLQHSGLLDRLLPAFTAESNVRVRVHAAGSGRSLEMLADGVVDVVLTHAPEAEARYLRAHPDWAYEKIAYNRFVLVGPPHDPAEVRDARDVIDAFRRIADRRAVFVSRGDRSGTHERETALWNASETRPAPADLIVSGRGMALALRHADELDAYTLTDEATFQQLRAGIDLAILFQGDPRMLNTYGVVHPRSLHHATALAAWLSSGPGRTLIQNYTASGRAVFAAWPEGCARHAPEAHPCSMDLAAQPQ